MAKAGMGTSRHAIRDRFSGKVAIVTGGASGIGRATVEELCKEGAAVAFTDISAAGETMARTMTGAGFDVLFCQGDMADETFCRAAVEQAGSRWGRIDYLFNNAFSFTAKALDASRDDWERVMQVGPMAFALMGTLVADSMKSTGRRIHREYVEHLGLHRPAQPLDLQRGERRCAHADQVHGA